MDSCFCAKSRAKAYDKRDLIPKNAAKKET